MPVVRSVSPRATTLTAWVRSWLCGLAPLDDVLHRVSGDGTQRVAVEGVTAFQGVTAFEGVAGASAGGGGLPLGWVLGHLRAAGLSDVRLVLPVPGDVGGPPGPFVAAALDVGEGLLAVTPSGVIGLVPGSGEPSWQAFDVPSGTVTAPPPPPLGEAELGLQVAVRGAADALAALEVARWRPEAAPALERLRQAVTDSDLAPGYPSRAHRLLAQADRLARVVDIAAEDPGAAVGRGQLDGRDLVLRDLAAAVRRARLAAYNVRLQA